MSPEEKREMRRALITLAANIFAGIWVWVTYFFTRESWLLIFGLLVSPAGIVMCVLGLRMHHKNKVLELYLKDLEQQEAQLKAQIVKEAKK